MEVVISKQGYTLTIAAWQLAAERLGVSLADMGETEQKKMLWALILSAAQLYNSNHGKRWNKRKENRLVKRIKKEHVKYELGNRETSTIKTLSDKLEEAFAEDAGEGDGSKKK